MDIQCPEASAKSDAATYEFHRESDGGGGAGRDLGSAGTLTRSSTVANRDRSRRVLGQYPAGDRSQAATP